MCVCEREDRRVHTRCCASRERTLRQNSAMSTTLHTASDIASRSESTLRPGSGCATQRATSLCTSASMLSHTASKSCGTTRSRRAMKPRRDALLSARTKRIAIRSG